MTAKDTEESRDFFDCVRKWSYGARRKTVGYYSKLNVKVTESQKESVLQLIRQGHYETISAFLRSAIESKLEEYQR